MFLVQCRGMESWITACSDVCLPTKVAEIVSTIYTMILVVVPLLLIISGMVTMGSAILKKSEEDIKKQQNLLIKKTVAAIIVFLLLTLGRMLITFVSDDATQTSSITACLDALFNYNENGGYVCKKGSAECNAGTDNFEFATKNNECRNAGADGAILIEESLSCFTRDELNCKCTNEDDIPFKYHENGETKNDCHCAYKNSSGGWIVRGSGNVCTASNGKVVKNGCDANSTPKVNGEKDNICTCVETK